MRPPSEKNNVAAGDGEKYNVEFRSDDDDAWYSVRVVLESEEVMRIKFMHFGESHDKLFDARSFASLDAVNQFKKRFRPVSLQLQDNECRRVVDHETVCACFQHNAEDVRFYDANVIGVQENEHSFKDGEEECLCVFTLYWLHGPVANTNSNASVADICKIQPPSGLDPIVASFLKIAKERAKATANPISLSNGASGQEIVPLCNGIQNTKQKKGLLDRIYKETRCARRSIVQKPSSCEDRVVQIFSNGVEDRDLGGKKNFFMILVENLDKTLTSLTIEECLHKYTSLFPEVYIFPSSPWELFTRGAFVCDSEVGFRQLCNFLNDPTQIVISSTGRPWVIGEEVVGLKHIRASIGALLPTSKSHTFHEEYDEKRTILKIVREGTQEFKVASDLRDVFIEFSTHQKQLHKRLRFDEGMVLLNL